MEDHDPLAKARQHIDAVRGLALGDAERRDRAIELAALLMAAAQRLQRPDEALRQHRLSAMLKDNSAKRFVTKIADVCFRSAQDRQLVSYLGYLMAENGLPPFLTRDERWRFRLLPWLGALLPRHAMELVRGAIRREMSGVIAPAEGPALRRLLERCRSAGVRVNVNQLGEAILGEGDASQRLKGYLAALAQPDIDYISVKISSIYSQINLLAWDESLAALAERLRQLYRAALRHPVTAADGSQQPKFVNLDMEEQRDLLLTVELFCRVLSEEEFHQLSAGIVLQSYLLDSFAMQQHLTEWARERRRRGGAPVKLRLVKGANLAMERYDAVLHGWPQAPYQNKWESDANFKRMLHYACSDGRSDAINVGVASHNLFEIAYALLLRSERRLERSVSFEMLEGMAPHIQRAVQSAAGAMLVYCPTAHQDAFHSAIAYLLRRLDENSAPENFLHALLEGGVDNYSWRMQREQFSYACDAMPRLSSASRRTQDRRHEQPAPHDRDAPFANEPNTDFSLPHNRSWIVAELRRRHDAPHVEIPLCVGGAELFAAHKQDGIDPSRPPHRPYSYQLADDTHIQLAIETARKAASAWSRKGVEERSSLLYNVAAALRRRRAALISAMVLDGAKPVSEADAEVSEAIDFCEYYRRSAEELHYLDDLLWQPRGVALVTPPWNFPCSISAGGIAASLAAGNSVLYKPAPQTPLVGWELAQAFWEGGVSRELLQFITCTDEQGSQLVASPAVDAVILTGAGATARSFLTMRPGLSLCAETGGKNAIIVTDMADRDLAVRDIVYSAFGHAGQKCSACSLVIMTKGVSGDQRFLEQLADAAASLPVGSAWQLSTRVPPLIEAPNAILWRALNNHEEGERWLLEPRPDPRNQRLWSPGIKLGVQPSSFLFQNELFGPLLALVEARDLTHAIELVNSLPYALTGGIHSLDEREQRQYLEQIQVGNRYVNRAITGAIVQRQPFGGQRESCYGPGAKAGGPNYVAQLMIARQQSLPRHPKTIPDAVAPLDVHVQGLQLPPDSLHRWRAGVQSYAFFWQEYFAKGHDPSAIDGQYNVLSYRPRQNLILRLQNDDALLDFLLAAAAALTVGAPLTVSATAATLLRPGIRGVWHRQCPSIRFIEEDDSCFVTRLDRQCWDGVRFLNGAPPALLDALAAKGIYSVSAAPLANGRIELLRYLREVTTSHDWHRYGYLGSYHEQHFDHDADISCSSQQEAVCCGGRRCSDIM